MDWKRVAIEDLQKYPMLKQSLVSIPEKIQSLEESFTAVRSSVSDSEPVSGGTSHAEDRLISLIAEQEKLKLNYSVAKRQVKIIEDALANLTEKEKLVLERFYIHHIKGHVERLCLELQYEDRQIYRIKDDALRKFAEAMYGFIDL